MKTINFIIGCLFIISFQNCSETPSVGAHLEEQVFLITTGENVKLETKAGVQIFIKENSFSEKGKSIELKVKEAISKGDMVLGNLSTFREDEKPLVSDGMLKIYTDDEIKIDENNPIKIRIPTYGFSTKMKVFEGINTTNGLRWGNETELIKNESFNQIESGRNLFYSNCASCHNKNNLSLDMTGPALGHITKVRNKAFLYAFTRNSFAVIKSGNRLANCIYSEFNNSAMTAFPNLSDKELDALYTFIENESISQGFKIEDVKHFKNCNEESSILSDSELEYLDELNESHAEIGKAKRQYYVTLVDKFKWLNIDKYFDYEGETMNDLQVDFETETDLNLVYASIILKNEKTVLSLYKNNKIFSLAYKGSNSKFGFPANKDAALVVWGIKKEQYYIGVKEIKTKKSSNNHSVKLKEVTNSEFKNILSNL